MLAEVILKVSTLGSAKAVTTDEVSPVVVQGVIGEAK